jgi:hypothetical protein
LSFSFFRTTELAFIPLALLINTEGSSTIKKYPIRYAFRLDPATDAALEQIAQHTFQSKAPIMRRYVQEGAKREVEA